MSLAIGEPPITRCSSCQAPIIWAQVGVTSPSMPVDAEPTANGNLRLYRKKDGGRVYAVVLGKPDIAKLEPGAKLRTSHFATCPHAAEHRRRKP